jgi:hypothetical protein
MNDAKKTARNQTIFLILIFLLACGLNFYLIGSFLTFSTIYPILVSSSINLLSIIFTGFAIMPVFMKLGFRDVQLSYATHFRHVIFHGMLSFVLFLLLFFLSLFLNNTDTTSLSARYMNLLESFYFGLIIVSLSSFILFAFDLKTLIIILLRSGE